MEGRYMRERRCAHQCGGRCLVDVDGSACTYIGYEDDCYDYVPPDRLVMHYIPAELIDPRPGNRDIGDVTELADSIRSEGIHTPLTVCPHVDGIEGRYTAVAGNRRRAAGILAGLSELPCIVREMTARERITMMLSENIQRKEMTPLEEADAMQQLMLALPEGSAAAVARETGISETTVRRRLKLLELDRQGLEQANGRGATLGDYEKLNQIKDPGRKNRVLAAIGTADFDRILQAETRNEKREFHLDRLAGILEKKGAVRLCPEEWKTRTDLLCEKTIHCWDLDETAVVGKLDRDESWCYTAGIPDGIRIYKVRRTEPEQSVHKTDVQTAREELDRLTADIREQLEGLRQEAVQLDQEFLDLREQFVGEFSTFARNREEIMEFAARAIIVGTWWSDERMEELAGWLDVPVEPDPERKGSIRLNDEALGRVIRANPEKVLLYSAYCMMEKNTGSWFEQGKYNGSVGCCVLEAKRDCRLDQLYRLLKLLGYQMSSDEQAAQAGRLPICGQAARILETYKEVKRDLEKRIKL